MMASLSWVAFTALLLACDYSASKNINSFAGPFIAYAHRFDVCPSDGTVIYYIKASHFNPAKPYERQRIVGNLTLNSLVDDSFWAHVSLASRSNNEWKENAFIANFPSAACSMMREHMPSLFFIATRYNPGARNKKNPCVVKQGLVELKNESVSWEFPKFKVMPYGRYRFTLTAGNKGSQLKKMCLTVDSEIIPKP